MKFFYDRNISETFEKNLDEFENSLKNQASYFSSEALLAFNEIEELKYNYQKTHEKILHKDSIDSKSDTLLRSKQYLTLHFFIEMVSDYVIHEIMGRKFEAKPAEPINLENLINPEGLKVLLKDDQMKEVYNVYMLLYKTFRNFSNEIYYFDYKNSIEKNLALIHKDEVSFHFSSMVSYCLLKKNSGHSHKFVNELWELYETILNNELYSNSKSQYLDVWLYRAILFLGLKLKYFEKVKRFIDKFSVKVKPSEIRNIKKLSYAYYHYETGDYHSALEHAKFIKLSNFVFKYDIKNLLIKIYYEQSYFENLESLIHNYRDFLKNDIILYSNLKNEFQNFLNYVEQLIKCSACNDNSELEYQLNK